MFAGYPVLDNFFGIFLQEKSLFVCLLRTRFKSKKLESAASLVWGFRQIVQLGSVSGITEIRGGVTVVPGTFMHDVVVASSAREPN